jgi:hypothetical protein
MSPTAAEIIRASRACRRTIMTTMSKTLLSVTVTGLVAGSIIDFGRLNLNPSWEVVLPFGAIAYGLFMISFMLEKEAAGFDEDEEKELQLIKDSYSAPAPSQKPAEQPVIIQLPVEKFGH